MAIEFHLFMPIEKEQMGFDATKELIDFLAKSGYIKLDMSIEVWEDDCFYGA